MKANSFGNLIWSSAIRSWGPVVTFIGLAAAKEVPKSERDLKKELDFYNVRENRLKLFDRDDYKCRYCSKQLTRFTATLDHVQPVSKGGDNNPAPITSLLSTLSCFGT